MIRIEIPGEPIGKGRPRFGHGRTYSPEKTQRWEQAAAWEARRQYDGEPMEGPLTLTVAAEFTIPKSWPKWRQEAAERGPVWHTIRPDASNVLKAVEDALQGVVYRDDSQIVAVAVQKTYSLDPKVVVFVDCQDRLLHSNSKKADIEQYPCEKDNDAIDLQDREC
jgi:Holliday junction resolvase RusA-like endonuclease